MLNPHSCVIVHISLVREDWSRHLRSWKLYLLPNNPERLSSLSACLLDSQHGTEVVPIGFEMHHKNLSSLQCNLIQIDSFPGSTQRKEVQSFIWDTQRHGNRFKIALWWLRTAIHFFSCYAEAPPGRQCLLSGFQSLPISCPSMYSQSPSTFQSSTESTQLSPWTTDHRTGKWELWRHTQKSTFQHTRQMILFPIKI